MHGLRTQLSIRSKQRWTPRASLRRRLTVLTDQTWRLNRQILTEVLETLIPSRIFDNAKKFAKPVGALCF
jgi:hypothetical protein